MPRQSDMPDITPAQTVASQEFRGVQFYPKQRLVEIRTRRSNLAIADEVTVISYDVLEGLFLALLTMQLQARGITLGLQPN